MNKHLHLKVKNEAGEEYIFSIEYDESYNLIKNNYPIMLGVAISEKVSEGEKEAIERYIKKQSAVPAKEDVESKAYIEEQITTEKNEEGVSVVTGVSPQFQEMMKFFSLDTPCFFEGCEEMREKYKKDLDKLGGDGCKGCKKGALIRKYIPFLKRLPEFQDEEAVAAG
jgi:hypothetical protein